MKLKFLWENAAWGDLVPRCQSDVVNKDGTSLLACLLMDDGGLRLQHSVSWIGEGIAKIDAVASGEIAEWDWGRETWGATLTSGKAVIYFLLDEDYNEAIDLPALRLALVAWREFIQSVPDINAKREIEI